MSSRLKVVEAPHFYAGLVVEEGKVVRAAPIIKYMVGWTWARAHKYAMEKQWRIHW